MSRSALQLHLRHGAMSSAWPPRLYRDELIERDPEQDSVDARDRTDRRVEPGIQWAGCCGPAVGRGGRCAVEVRDVLAVHRTSRRAAARHAAPGDMARRDASLLRRLA